jgi:putative flippase GtrA
LTNRKELSRFLRFSAVGIIGAVVDFGTFNLFTLAFGVPALWSTVVSFTAAVVSNFVWNRLWTYPDSRSKPISRQLGQFIAVSLVGLGIRTPLFAVLEPVLIKLAARYVPVQTLSPVFVGHNVALAIAVLVVMMWNFFANRLWTYGDIS